MTIFVDTSALLVRLMVSRDTSVVDDLMQADPVWCVSDLARAEIGQVLRLATTDASERAALESRFRDDWAACRVVPLDERCLVRTAELGAEHRLAISRAVPLAAADRLPRPLTYLTLDADQIPPALALGLDPAPG